MKLTEQARMARIYQDAAHALLNYDVNGECCGIPLDRLGQCQHRPHHPTTWHPSPNDYPDRYDDEGRLIC